MNVIFLIGSAQALFFSLLIFNKKNKGVSDKLLGIWLLVLAIHLVFPYLLYSSNYKNYIHLGGLDSNLIAVHASMLFVYTRSLITRENRFHFKWLLHLVPAFLVTISLIPFILNSTEEKIFFYNMGAGMPNFYYLYVSIMLLIGIILFYTIRTMLVIKKHKANIHGEFSYEENIDLKWLHRLILIFLSFAIFLFATTIALNMNGISIIQADFLMYIFIVAFVYCIGYWGYKQGRIFSYLPNSGNLMNPQRPIHKKNENTLDSLTSEDRIFIDKLKAYMIAEKPHINSELNLHDLSHALDVSSSYLSHTLNNSLHLNFYQFVNRYRVEEAKKRIQENSTHKYTLLSIGFDSGFNSKASFNRIFKNVTQMTPSEYQKTL